MLFQQWHGFCTNTAFLLYGPAYILQICFASAAGKSGFHQSYCIFLLTEAVMQRDFIFATQVGRLALELSNRLSTPVDKG
jgi:hypothetical protein